MRAVLFLPLLALAACQVTKDDANDQVTVEYNADIAENGVEAAAAKAEDIAGKISNDVEQTADKVENRVEDVNVKVDVDTGKKPAETNSN